MFRRTWHWGLIAAFAIVLGHFTWETWLSPVAPADYTVGGRVAVLESPEPDTRHLYLRRTIYLPQRPRAAWMRILSKDRVKLYVNGRLVEGQTLDGYAVAVVVDIAPFLAIGPNVVAIHARQTSLRRAPAVSIDGAYTLSDGAHPLETDGKWYCGTAFERKADWWFGKDFDERHWPFARVSTQLLRAHAIMPPEMVTTPDRGYWITPPSVARDRAAVRKEFTVAGRPRQAWLRLTSTASYRLALNGTIIDQQESDLAVQVPWAPVRRLYDISPLIRSGSNVISIMLNSPRNLPRVLVDAEVTSEDGATCPITGDGTWLSQPGFPADWLALGPTSENGWEPCRVESGDLEVPPWGPRRQVMTVARPWSMTLSLAAREALVMLFIATLAVFGCHWVERFLSNLLPRPLRWSHAGVLALALPTLAGATAILATFDPRVPRQDVYRSVWLLLALASVPLQWTWLALTARGPCKTLASSKPTPGGAWGLDVGLAIRWSILILFACIGFWFRYRELASEPLQWDEVENFKVTQGVFKYGFPKLEVHPDLPPLVIHTSELQFVFNALAALVRSDSEFVVRFPAVCFGVATIFLLYYMGSRMFNTRTGLAAAVLASLASVYIPMGTVGRYFSELQFFTLLTIYLFWRMLQGTGPLRPAAVWATVASFLAMFLTWEASALVTPALVLAGVIQRRGQLKTMLINRHVWGGAGLTLAVYLLQRSNVNLAQTQFLWFGISLSDVRLLPMWSIQSFQPWYYLWESSWSQDALLPLLGVLLALAFSVAPGGQSFRFLALVYIPTCLEMAFLLPNYQFRYIYHVSPLGLLLATAALCRLADEVQALVAHEAPVYWRHWSAAVSWTCVGTLVLLASGLFLEMRYLGRLRVDGVSCGLYKFPDLGGPARYVAARMQPGDVVMSNNLYQTNHLMGQRERSETDYVPMTGRLFLPATLLDHSPTLVDRRDGAKVIATPQDFVELFARHPRIWYIVQAGQHYNQNTPTISDFVSENMDIVYEDYDCFVLFRGPNHRPAAVRFKDQQTLEGADAKFLD